MPVVPRVSTGQVQPTTLPSARFSADAPLEAFGGGASTEKAFNAAGNLAQESANIFLQEKKNADDVVTQEAYSKLVTIKNTLAWDPKNGAFTKKGKDAFGAVDEYGAEFDKSADDIELSLNNDAQKQMFRRIRSKEKAEFNGMLQKHVFQEAKNFDDQTTKASISNTQNDAILNYQNPGKVENSIRLQESLIMSYAERNGMDAETTRKLVEESRSTTQSSIINRMLGNGQDLAAKEYFNGVKDQLTGDDVTRIEKNLKEGSVRGESQRQASQIIKKYGTNDLSSALEDARQIKDPDVQSATVHEIKLRYSEFDAVQRVTSENRFQRAYFEVEQTKNRPSPEIWNSMSSVEKNSIDTRIQQLKSGTPPTTDWNKYFDLKALASNPDTQEKFLQMNLYVYGPSMAEAEFKEIIKLQSGLRQGNKEAHMKLDGYRSDASIVNDALTAAGYDPTPKPNSKDAKAVNAFRAAVDSQVRLLQEQTQKKVTNDQLQGIVDNMIVKGVTKKGTLSTAFFDQKKRFFELDPNEDFSVDIRDIPTPERRKIEQALSISGMAVTESNITNLYNKKIKLMRSNGQ